MKTDKTTTTTTVTTTTRRKKVPAPEPRLRLVTRVRKIVLRTAVAKRSTARRGAKAALPMKGTKVISVTTTRALPKPKPAVSELTVQEREALRDARGTDGLRNRL